MKENRFIAQNKEKWNESETLLTNPVKDPEKLSNLFIQVVDDLSYSRTYYPNRSVRLYLNNIARQYFSLIYSHKKERRNRLKLFWFDELPQIIIHSRKQLLVSLLVFLLAMTIGAFSAMKDPQFASTILGKSYVTMTEENIQNGDPMGVYKDSRQIDMFLGITLNNLVVAFRTYVLGIFLAIGTLASLLSNGIMVGCFQYFFIERGLGLESSLTIWLHGTLEISSIILAGGAGLTLGSGLIFPGTYSRLQSLQISGIRSLKLMLGIAPVFVLAAIIESFLTRYTEAPAFLKIILIMASAIFIIGYFIIYPWKKSKTGFEFPIKDIRLPASNIEAVNFTRIKNNADILKDTFQFYSKNINHVLPWIAIAAAGMSIATLVFGEQTESFILEQNWWLTLLTDMVAAMNTPSAIFIIVNALGISLVFYRVMTLIDSEYKKSKFKFDARAFAHISIFNAIIYTAIYLGGWGIFMMICCFGVLVFAAFVHLTEHRNLFSSISFGWDLFIKNNNQGFGLQFILLLLSFSFLLVLSAPLLYMHMSIIQWNFLADDVWSRKAIHLLELFIKTFSFLLIVPVITASFSYLYFTQQEVSSARDLKESIEKFGVRISKGGKR